MAATTYAVYTINSGSSLVNAWPQVGNGLAANLDLLQIIGFGGSVLSNVTYAGVVNTPAVAATNGTRIGVFQTNLTSSATTAQLFASAFENLSQQDIIQCINEGGNVSFWLDYLGVAHGS
jgi:hypothetical protein